VADDDRVLRAVAGSESCGVLAEGDIEHPVEGMVNRPEGFHFQPLSERCGSLSTHTAPIKQTLPQSRSANVRTDGAASLPRFRGRGLPASYAL
jgi:hypothetical protein